MRFKAALALLWGICCLANGTALAQQGTVVRLSTDVGVFDVRLADDDTPLTVANFLAYVNAGAYDNTFVDNSYVSYEHRFATRGNDRPFIVQGGSSRETNNRYEFIPRNAPVVNESGLTHSRGSIAMARSRRRPNSATSQWFINRSDNASLLDQQDGGYTVFGVVLDNGMAVVDAIAALPRRPYPFDNIGANLNFDDMPLDGGYTAGQTTPPTTDNIVVVQSIKVVVDLPEIVGLSEAAAREALTTAGFTVGAVGGAAGGRDAAACSAVGYPGVLNSRVVPGSEVNLKLAIRRTTFDFVGNVVPRFVVPDLSGMSFPNAASAITNAELSVGIEAGRGTVVVSQSIAAGEVVACGSTVDFVLDIPGRPDAPAGAFLVPLLDMLLEDEDEDEKENERENEDEAER